MAAVPDIRSGRVTLTVGGMNCASCAAKVEKALRGLAGASDARVMLASGRAFVSGNVASAEAIRAVKAAGYEAEVETSMDIQERINWRRDQRRRKVLYWKRKLILSVSAIPVVVLGMADMADIEIPGSATLQLILATLSLVLLAPPFYRSGLPDFFRLRFNMDSLISMGSLIAYLASLHGLYAGDHVYFEDAVAILAFLTLGRFLEARSAAKAAESVDSLIDLLPRVARVLRDGGEKEMDVRDVKSGDHVVIRPGEKSPVDGLVLQGAADADESLLTGESAPVTKKPESRVIAGSLIHGGRLVVQTEHVGSETALAEILREMETVGEGKTRYQNLADRVVAVFMPFVLLIAMGTFVAWYWTVDDLGAALRPTIAVLIIACPCALGIAIPIAVSVGAAVASRRGILIREASALDRLPRIRAIVLDKTGSVTRGKFRLVDYRSTGIDREKALELAAALENASEHPLGRALVAARASRVHPTVEEFRAHPGEGVEGLVEGRRVRVGNPSWIGAPDSPREWLDEQDASGRSVFAAAFAADRDSAAAYAWFALEDTPRKEACDVVMRLRSRGFRMVLLSGDREEAVRRVAGSLGFDDYRAAVRPARKAEVIRELRQTYMGVAMVGDGVNDAPALAESDFGLAMGGGTALAAEAGAAVLVRDDLRGIEDILRIGNAIRRKASQNLFWAFAYNVILIPAAAFGVAPPMAAAFAMAFSDVTVIANTLRLWKYAKG